MTARDLLFQLHAKGVQIQASGDDRLIIDAPRGAITPDLRAALGANKAELLQILKSEQVNDRTAANSETAVPVFRPEASIYQAPIAPALSQRKIATPAITDPDEVAAASTAEEIKQLEI